MIPFNKPPVTGDEIKNIQMVLDSVKHCGDGQFTKFCSNWFEKNLGVKKALLTTSGTHALEMAAILADLGPSDEVIMPSYTFVSTANAFVLRGAVPVFIDIDPITMNMNPKLIEKAITPRTKAVCVVHYAGLSCDMDEVLSIVKNRKLILIEDAAQAVGGMYKDKPLGTLGDYGCFSFHETKNISCGEGGLLTINKDTDACERAEVIREKGTNRSKFWRGQVDKYTWTDIGSSYLPSEFNTAVLASQLGKFTEIQEKRIGIWKTYENALKTLVSSGKIESMITIPEYNKNNAHMFWIKLKNIDVRTEFISALKEKGITAVFHYIPLHSSPAGMTFGRFSSIDNFTTRESEKLVRLPLYFNMTESEQSEIINAVLACI